MLTRRIAPLSSVFQAESELDELDEGCGWETVWGAFGDGPFHWGRFSYKYLLRWIKYTEGEKHTIGTLLCTVSSIVCSLCRMTSFPS